MIKIKVNASTVYDTIRILKDFSDLDIEIEYFNHQTQYQQNDLCEKSNLVKTAAKNANIPIETSQTSLTEKDMCGLPTVEFPLPKGEFLIDCNDQGYSTSDKHETKRYYNKAGSLHRNSDLPAIVFKSGRVEYWFHGLRHRDPVAGPAIDDPHNSIKEYWVRGTFIRSNKFY